MSMVVVLVIPLTNKCTHTQRSTQAGRKGISLADSHPHSWRLSHCVCADTDHRAGETLSLLAINNSPINLLQPLGQQTHKAILKGIKITCYHCTTPTCFIKALGNATFRASAYCKSGKHISATVCVYNNDNCV